MDRRHERRRSCQWRSHLESIFIVWANLEKAKVAARSKQVNWWVASQDDGPGIWASLEAGRLISHDVCSRHQRGVRAAQGPTWQGRCERDGMVTRNVADFKPTGVTLINPWEVSE